MWNDIGYSPHPGQTEVHGLIRRHKFFEGEMGRQWGKSTMSARGVAFTEWARWKETVKHPWEWPRSVLLIAPYLDQSEIIFQECYELAQARGIPLKRDRASGKLDLITREGCRLRCMSGQNPKAMRGYQWHWIIIDEGSYLKNLKDIVNAVLKPMLIKKRGRLMIVGSPDAPGSDTHEFAMLGDNPEIPEWGHLKSPSVVNWHMPMMAEWIEQERRIGTPEDIIRREYMAEFIPRAGLAYPEYLSCVMNAREIESIESLAFSQGHWGRCIDFGFTNPFVAITVVELDETIYVWDEYYRRHLTKIQHAPNLARHDRLYDYSLNVCDSEDPDGIHTLKNYQYRTKRGTFKLKGAWILKFQKPPVVDRVDNLRRLMAIGRVRIHPRCRLLLKEFGLERYAEEREQRNVDEKPMDKNNHGTSALGYWAYHRYGRPRISAADIYRDDRDSVLDSFGGLKGYPA